MHPVPAIKGGEGDTATESGGGDWRGKGRNKRDRRGKGRRREGRWNGLSFAKREKGSILVVWRCVGLVLFCLIMFCLVLSCWARECDGDRKPSDGSEDRGTHAAVTTGKGQYTEREGFGLVLC